MGPNDKIHTLLPVGTGQEGRTSSNEETHQTFVFLGVPEPRRVHGRYWEWWEVYGKWLCGLPVLFFVILFCFVNHDDRMYLDKFKRVLKAI